MLSYFGILDYNYDSRYYLQASIREDGSSLFGQDNQWGLFWSVGLSWNAHNEKFMKDLTWLNVAKLRVSYGVNGNNNIAAYQQFGTYTSSSYNGLTGLRPSTPANTKLSWEKNYSWNVGIDFRFLKRFSGSIDFYTRKTTDIFELASGITMQTSVQCVAMQPNNLTELPQFEIDFLKQLPTTWEETRFIDGYPGKYVILARKATNGQWYIAGLNALKEPLPLTLDLQSMGLPIGEFTSLYLDNKAGSPTLSPLKIGKKARLKVTLQPNGGLIIK